MPSSSLNARVNASKVSKFPPHWRKRDTLDHALFPSGPVCAQVGQNKIPLQRHTSCCAAWLTQDELQQVDGRDGARVQSFDGEKGQVWFNHLTGESGIIPSSIVDFSTWGKYVYHV